VVVSLLKKFHVPALNALVLDKIITVKAVFSRTENSALETKALLSPNEHVKVCSGKDGLSDILNDKEIDAVVICLPIDIQPSVVLMALEAGKHVLSEKPVAPYSKIGQDLVTYYEQRYSSLVWGIAENYCYEPYFLEAKKYLQEGRIGQVRVVIGNSFSLIGSDVPYFHTQWRKESKYLGGYVLDGGVHMIATLRLLVGDIECVRGYQNQFDVNLPPSDSIACSFKCKSGALGTLALSFACNTIVSPFKEHAPPLFMIYGDKGTLAVSRDKLEMVYTDNNGQKQTVKPHLSRNQNLTAIVKEFECFVTAIRAKSSKSSSSEVYTPSQALQDVLFIEAIFEYGQFPLF